MSSRSQEATSEQRTTDDPYTIRWCDSGDADGILSLFESELDRERSRAYFEWKYAADPYLSHAPITVAERDGDLVGVQAYLPCELRDGDRTVLALQPADAVVHADHRRNGLYTRMTRQAIERYAEHEAGLFFNYPTPGALGAQEKMGWKSLGELAVHYRVQRPSSFLDGAGRLVERVADPLASVAYGAVDAFAPTALDLDVTKHDSAPAHVLASVYETAVPRRLHVHREARFYEWWLANPFRSYSTYVARSDGRPVATLVTHETDSDVLQLRDALPLGDDRPTRALARLLSVALADHPDADVVKSVGSTFPHDLLRRFGFVRDSSPLLDDRTESLTMAARPLLGGPGDGPLADAVTARSNWLPTFVELNKD